jgi:hypothetical protein
MRYFEIKLYGGLITIVDEEIYKLICLNNLKIQKHTLPCGRIYACIRQKKQQKNLFA